MNSNNEKRRNLINKYFLSEGRYYFKDIQSKFKKIGYEVRLIESNNKWTIEVLNNRENYIIKSYTENEFIKKFLTNPNTILKKQEQKEQQEQIKAEKERQRIIEENAIKMIQKFEEENGIDNDNNNDKKNKIGAIVTFAIVVLVLFLNKSSHNESNILSRIKNIFKSEQAIENFEENISTQNEEEIDEDFIPLYADEGKVDEMIQWQDYRDCNGEDEWKNQVPKDVAIQIQQEVSSNYAEYVINNTKPVNSEVIKVLIVTNSKIYVNDAGGILAELAKTEGRDMLVVYLAHGNVSTKWIAKNSDSKIFKGYGWLNTTDTTTKLGSPEDDSYTADEIINKDWGNLGRAGEWDYAISPDYSKKMQVILENHLPDIGNYIIRNGEGKNGTSSVEIMEFKNELESDGMDGLTLNDKWSHPTVRQAYMQACAYYSIIFGTEDLAKDEINIGEAIGEDR